MAARPNIAALALTLVATGGVALGARCMTPGLPRCSLASLTGRAPHLDVPYLGTRPEVVARMLDLAQVRPGDRVLDLGTGDGRILITAARRGATGLGVDIDPVLIAEARAAAARAGVADRARFAAQDLFATPLAGRDVVTMYLLPAVNLRLRPRLLAELRPGARVVSHAFDMGDWRPDVAARVGGAKLYLWRVPARIEGDWRLVEPGRSPARLLMHQHFQDVGGTLIRDGRRLPLTDTRLDGDRLRFAVDDGSARRTYEGVVRGGAISGVGPTWRATRGPSGSGSGASSQPPRRTMS